MPRESASYPAPGFRSYETLCKRTQLVKPGTAKYEKVLGAFAAGYNDVAFIEFWPNESRTLALVSVMSIWSASRSGETKSS